MISKALAITGDDVFECKAALRKVCSKLKIEPQSVARSELYNRLYSPFLGVSKSLLVISDLSRSDMEAFQMFAEDITSLAYVVLMSPSAKPKKRKKVTSDDDNYLLDAIELLPEKQVLEFKLPPFYKEKEVAVSFLISTLKNHGKVISSDLSEAIVQRVGREKGVLAYEAQKMALLAGSDTEITPKIAGSIVAPLAETPLEVLGNALIAHSENSVISCLRRIKATYDQPLMLVCAYILSKVESWLIAVDFQEKKLTAAQGAELLGRNAWEYDNSVYKPAKAFSRATLQNLVEAVAEAQQAQIEGCCDPMTLLESRLLQSFW